MGAHDITGLLLEWRNGNREALDQLTPLVYDELRQLPHWTVIDNLLRVSRPLLTRPASS